MLHTQEPSLTDVLGELTSKFQDVRLAGQGITREDVDVVVEKLRLCQREARKAQFARPTSPVNPVVAPRAELLYQAQDIIVEARQRLIGRMHDAEADPLRLFEAAMTDSIRLLQTARGVVAEPKGGAS